MPPTHVRGATWSVRVVFEEPARPDTLLSICAIWVYKPLLLGWWPSPIIWKSLEFRPWHILEFIYTTTQRITHTCLIGWKTYHILYIHHAVLTISDLHQSQQDVWTAWTFHAHLTKVNNKSFNIPSYKSSMKNYLSKSQYWSMSWIRNWRSCLEMM